MAGEVFPDTILWIRVEIFLFQNLESAESILQVLAMIQKKWLPVAVIFPGYFKGLARNIWIRRKSQRLKRNIESWEPKVPPPKLPPPPQEIRP